MVYPRLPGGLPARSWQADRDYTDFTRIIYPQMVLSTDYTDFTRIIYPQMVLSTPVCLPALSGKPPGRSGYIFENKYFAAGLMAKGRVI